ncbi:MAG: formimidoylglutamase [Saprospiraceae bacterium]
MNKSNYIPPHSSIWTGRKTPSELGHLYYYQAIELNNLQQKIMTNSSKNNFVILGYECDEGVRRNNGRLGAEQGPKEIIKALGKLAFHDQNCSIYYGGGIKCFGEDLESCQESFSQIITTLINQNITPIAIGGGHDIAYPHYLGIQKALGNSQKVGIINFDAHFDLRKMSKRGNSGTPFYQIHDYNKSHSLDFDYMVLGIQQASNTKDLFEMAEHCNVNYIKSEQCDCSNVGAVKEKVDQFLSGLSHIYVTVDMDGFASSFAPGVSAPSPMGFTPHFFFDVFGHIIDSDKVISMDIAEVNPIFDQDDCTSKLAARIIDFFVNRRG